MSDYLTLKTSTGHVFETFTTNSISKTNKFLIIIQEIFGVNDHIKEVCRSYSKHGYSTLSPCLFDREKMKIELNYDEKGFLLGRKLKDKYNEIVIQEIEATINYVKNIGKVFIIGFCWGGSIAWRSACTFDDLSATVVYYGGDIPKLKGLRPKNPVMCHFGKYDKSIPIAEIDIFKSQQQNVEVHKYPADHGFNCDHRSQYHKISSQLAFERTLNFFNKI